MAATENKPIYASQAQLYEKAVQKMNADRVIVQHAYKIDNYKIAAAMFDEVGDYEDAPVLAERCRELIKETIEDEKETTYQRCVYRMKDSATFLETDKIRKLTDSLQKLGDYKDSKEMFAKCSSLLRKKDRRHKAAVRSVLLILAALIVSAGVGWKTGYLKYMAGIAIMRYGKYETADKIFRGMPGYRNADAYAQQTEMSILAEAQVKDKLVFGDFTWQVLDVDEETNDLTLIAVDVNEEHLLFGVPFEEVEGPVTWATSSLREWLNGEILENSFSDSERERMVLQEAGATINPDYQTAYEDVTEDYIMIPSLEEAQAYMDILASFGNDMWIRTPGNTEDTVCYLSAGSHEIKTFGTPAADRTMTVRAVIRVSREGL